jgi:predicted nucleic acid-binding protein
LSCPESGDGPAILSLIRTSECSAYDCEFVWLAKNLSFPLVTPDKRVLQEFPDTAKSPEGYLGTG